MNIRGYLQWCARGLVREPLAWGLALNVLGFLAMIGGCPAPWPLALGVAGMTILVLYVAYYGITVSYHQYQREQRDTLERLRRK